MSRDATEIEEHLRAASDAILLLLTEVTQLERHKRAIPPGESRFDEVARSARIAAESLAEFTQQEEDWDRDGRQRRYRVDRGLAEPAGDRGHPRALAGHRAAAR